MLPPKSAVYERNRLQTWLPRKERARRGMSEDSQTGGVMDERLLPASVEGHLRLWPPRAAGGFRRSRAKTAAGARAAKAAVGFASPLARPPITLPFSFPSPLLLFSA